MSLLTADSILVKRGDRTILPSISVALATGKVIAVLGPNGTGKSTLLACLAGLLPPASGKICLDNEAVSQMAPSVRARRIGFLPQLAEIAWPVDVETLVGLGRIPHRSVASAADHQRAIAQAMRITGTAAWATRDVTTLSGGERARVLFARLLAGEPEWILADEPFAGLDPAHQFETAELLRSFAAAGRGVVLTLHDLTLAARVADRVILMSDGQIQADGPPDEALTSETLRVAYGIEAHWVYGSRSSSAPPLIAIVGRHRG